MQVQVVHCNILNTVAVESQAKFIHLFVTCRKGNIPQPLGHVSMTCNDRMLCKAN